MRAAYLLEALSREYIGTCTNTNIMFSQFLVPIPADEDVKSYCQNLTNEIAKVADIPQVCNKFPEVVKAMKTRIDERDAAIATQGMRAGSGNEARRALASGSLYQAQVTRRYTQTRRFSKQDKKASW